MEFWATSNSSLWDDDPSCHNLHDSLFNSQELKLKTKMSQKKKKRKGVKSGNGTDSTQVKKERTDQDKNTTKASDIVKKKRKKAAKSRIVPQNDEANGESIHVDKNLNNVWTAYSSKVSGLRREEGVSLKMDRVAEDDVHIASLGCEVQQSGIHAKNKRKRKARKNKFKDRPEGDDDKNLNGSNHNSSVGDADGGDSMAKADGCGERSERGNAPSRKEKRKLKRKMMRQKNSADKTVQDELPIKRAKEPTGSNARSGLRGNAPEKRDGILRDESGKDETEDKATGEGHAPTGLIIASSKRASKRGASLKSDMEGQLKSAQFRFLNEYLYKVTGKKAAEMFANDKAAFVTYHEGYTQQVEQWPVNPVDVVISSLKSRRMSELIGDFGCGDAKIARSVRQKVHSFDLYPINKHVTVCNVAKVPLKNNVLDVAVFCLSLMGTNWMEFVQEANRTLKRGGLLKVAEVASRFTSLPSFFSVMKTLGFHLKSKDTSNKMFYLFDFKKKQAPSALPSLKGVILKPCLYKKR